MLYFLVTKPHAYTMEWYLSDWGCALAERVAVVPYAKFLQSRNLYRGSYIFSDLDRVRSDRLSALQQRWRALIDSGMGIKMLNEPTQVKTRLPLLRELYERGINDFNVYPVAPGNKVTPKQFPVFIREANDHEGPITELIQDQAELDRTLEDCAGRGQLSGTPVVTEFVDVTDDSGHFRKYSAFRFGDRIVPAHINIGSEWVVKSTNSELDEDEVAEELAYIEDNPHGDKLLEIFAIANIDYGRIDYGLRNGRIQVFEINTNPIIMHPGQSSNPLRLKKKQLTATAIEQALLRLDP